MATVVFMRGVNVGGHNPFRPAIFAKQLSSLEVTNVGAAGTFIVHSKISEARLRTEFLRRLPVNFDFMICPGRDIVELIAADPFPQASSTKDARRFVSVLATRPLAAPRFPLTQPAGKAWQVKLLGLQAQFVVSLWRRTGKAMLYPNEVVEKQLATTATTRTWDTVAKIYEILQRT